MIEQFDRLCAALTDRYKIERELGSGGMATVYLAEDLKHHRKVAVKVLRPELAVVLGGDRFVKEIETPTSSTQTSCHCSIRERPKDSFIMSCRSSTAIPSATN